MSRGRRGATGASGPVTVLRNLDDELHPEEWWVVSQGSEGGQGKKGKMRSKRKREGRGGGAPSGCRGTSSSSRGRSRRPTSRRPWRRAMGTTWITGEAGVTTMGRGVTRG